MSDPRPFWDLVDETAVWIGADGEPETFPVTVLDGCNGRALPEIVSIVELGVQIGEVVTIDGKPLAPGSNIRLGQRHRSPSTRCGTKSGGASSS